MSKMKKVRHCRRLLSKTDAIGVKIKRNRATVVLYVAALLFITTSFTTPVEKAKLFIHIEHYAGMQPLQMDTVYYKNELGQTFTVSRFRYYLSNIKLKKTDGTEVNLPGYFLVDEADPESKSITLSHVPEGNYHALSFTIGVDSLHNCSGAQSGALDPVNGMFWTWNTGYIFMKMEGHADASTSPGHIFEYHIGGYMAPNNCIRKAELDFGKKGLTIYDNKDNGIAIKADVLQLLKTPTTIDFSRLSSVTDFHNATIIADNYADMFTINADE